MRCERCAQTIDAKENSLRILGLGDPVGVEQQLVAGGEFDAPLLEIDRALTPSTKPSASKGAQAAASERSNSGGLWPALAYFKVRVSRQESAIEHGDEEFGRGQIVMQ